MADYCDIGADLERVFPRLEEYQLREITENWTKTSGQTNVYEKGGVGHVGQVFENDTMYTVKTSVALVDATASTWYYDSNVDKVYIHTSGDDAPSGYTIECGEDWDAYLTIARDQAQQMIDARLKNLYVVPLEPRSRQIHNTANYEYDIVRVTALVTCWIVVSRKDADCKDAQVLYKQFWNPNPDIDEPKGLLNLLIDGDVVLQDQTSVREVGERNWNVYPNSSNTVTFQPRFFGPYTGTTRQMWRIQIDTAGGLGTATYKVSYDQGDNWDLTLKDTKDASKNQIRFYINSGISIVWPDTTYVKDEYWDLELIPQSDEPVTKKFGSAPITR